MPPGLPVSYPCARCHTLRRHGNAQQKPLSPGDGEARWCREKSLEAMLRLPGRSLRSGVTGKGPQSQALH